jgi:thiosulfate/3-mercaptopyruvate sulfurtransferase
MEGGPPSEHRKGHIPGAKSVPFTSPYTDKNELKPAAELRALFAAAGVKPGDTIIGYCHVGQQATAMLFAARSLGYKTVLYDGSFEDWAYNGWPVELPTKAGGGTK